ncbi:MAG: fibronectin type III domain-containing protein, partial [Clostridia bacterium]|nr:fibronectin type III domain-containing protein [Clostridia bacterium]
MNTTKRIICLAMCLLMLISIVPVSASAATAVFNIECDRLERWLITRSVPLRVSDFTVPDGFKVEAVQSKDKETGEIIEDPDKYIGGRTYTIDIVFSRNGGSIPPNLLNSTVIKVNGVVVPSSNITPVAGKVLVTVEKYIEKMYVRTFFLEGRGYKLGGTVYNFTVDETYCDGIHIRDYYFRDIDANCEVPGNDIFAADKNYALYVDLYIDEDFDLSPKFDFSEFSSIDLPVKSREFVYDGTDEVGRYICLKYVLEAPQYIEAVETTLDGYEYGAEVGDIVVKQNAKGAEFIGGQKYGGGYAIFADDSNGNKQLITDEATMFEYNTQYYLGVMLQAKEGYGFDTIAESDVTLKDCGLPFYYNKPNPDRIEVYFKLPKFYSANTVREVNLTLDGYKSGKAIEDITVSTDSARIELADDGYVNEYVIYGSTNTKPDHTVFLPDETYRLAVCFKVKSGYEFYLDDVAEIFNLEGATFESIKKSGNYYTAIFALPVLESEKITQVEIGLTAPVVGEKPDLTPELPADAAYYLSDSLTGVQWRENGVSGSPLPSYYGFKTIYTYNVTVSLLPKAGYEFADASVIVATINGKNAQVRFVGEKIILTYEFGKALCTEHDWKNADCNNPKTCRKCGATEGVALGHSWANADCDTPKTCNTCGITEGAALGHDWANADCDTPKTCNTCGATEGEALGHSWANADCDTPKTCNTCGATEGEALGHTGGTATCEKKAQCTVCGEKYGELAAHTGGTATCTAKAKCTVCGEAYGSVNKDNHKSLTTLNAVAATCTKTGLTEGKKCTDCGVTVTAQKTVAKTAHKEVELPGKAATYKETGLTEGKKCSVCGTVTVKQNIIAKLTLGKVDGLKAKKVKVAKKSEITLSWTSLGDGVKYEVYIKNGKKWTKLTTTSKTSYTVKKDGKKMYLKADKEYQFRVRAVVDDIKGKYSSTLKVETIP